MFQYFGLTYFDKNISFKVNKFCQISFSQKPNDFGMFKTKNTEFLVDPINPLREPIDCFLSSSLKCVLSTKTNRFLLKINRSPTIYNPNG